MHLYHPCFAGRAECYGPAVISAVISLFSSLLGVLRAGPSCRADRAAEGSLAGAEAPYGVA